MPVPAPASEWLSERFSGADFSGADLRRTHFEACEFIDCKFTNADLREAVFEDCSWLRCEVSNCNVSNAKFRGASFADSRVRGVVWANCYKFALELGFTKSNLSYSSFNGLHLQKIEFIECCLREVDFGDCCLAGANFAASDLGGAIFHHTDLRGADMSTAHSVMLDLHNNEVKGLQISVGGAVDLLEALGVIVALE